MEHHHRWFIRGERFKKDGNFRGASEAFREALTSAIWMIDDRAQIDCLAKLGVVYWNLGDLAKSRKSYEEALALAVRGHLASEMGKCRLALDIDRLYRKGKDFSRANQLQKCIGCFKRAIELSKRLSSPDHEAKCLRWVSTAYYEQNDLNAFYEFNKKALQIYQRLRNEREKLYCIFNIGLYYKLQFELTLAAKYFYDGINIAQKLNLKSEEVDCHVCMGGIFADIGLYDKAIAFYLNAQKILQNQSKLENYYSLFNNLGVLYRRKSELDAKDKYLKIALSFFYEALNSVWQSGDKREEARILNNIGYALIKLGRYPEALKILESGYKKAIYIGSPDLISLNLINRGHVFLEQRRITEAVGAFKNAVSLLNHTIPKRFLWEAYWGLGRCFEIQNNLSAAERAYRNSIALIEGDRNKLSLEADKAGFVRDKIAAYESLIHLLYRHYQLKGGDAQGAQIISIMERAKAQAFVETIRGMKLQVKPEITIEGVRIKEDISRSISILMRTLSRTDLPAAQRENLWGELSQQEEKYARWNDPAGLPDKRLFRGGHFSMSQIQDYLRQNKTAVFEYLLGDERSYLAFLTGSAFKVFPLPSRSSVENSIRLYIKMVSSSSEEKFRGGLAARRLYQELLFPITQARPGDIENLVIIPDGLLYYLPFETLISGDEPGVGSGRFLVENFSVSYAPSVSALMWISSIDKKRKPAKSLLAVGDPDYGFYAPQGSVSLPSPTQVLREMYLDQGFSLGPLPYTRTEIINISRNFPKEKVDIFLRDQASEEAIKKSPMTDYQVIHFACHGFLDERFPLRSALVLSPAGSLNEDGFLQVREIFNLRVQASLVVLSACQTGRGTLEKGEGLLGLPRVFFYIGAKSVIAALWPINDRSTSMFMKEFYSGLCRGLSKSRALREAKLSMLRSQFSHPFFWAAFVLNGDYRSTIDFH